MKQAQVAEDAGFLKEFQDFVSFLQHLWGLLAGISVLFPLSNVLVKVLPLDRYDNGGALVWLSPSIFTTVATVVSLFVILWTFGQRSRFHAASQRSAISKGAWGAFLAGLTALILYLGLYYFIGPANGAYGMLGWGSGDMIRLLGEIPMLLLYAAFFALLTRAFVMLGMIEFFRKEAHGAS